MKGKTALRIYFFLFVGWMCCTSCATITSRSRYPVIVESNPPSALLTVTDKKGVKVFQAHTPTVFNLKCNCGIFKPGAYKLVVENDNDSSRSLELKCRLNPWYFGNFMISPYGFILDPLLGGIFRMDTKYVKFDFDSTKSPVTTSRHNPYKAKLAAMMTDTVLPGRFIVATNILQFPTGDFSLYGEYAVKKNTSIGVSGGMIFPIRSKRELRYGGFQVNDDLYPFWVYNGYAVRLYTKFYSTKKPGHYFSPLVMYKNLRYDHYFFSDRIVRGEDIETYERSEKAQVFSIQLLWGKEKVTKHILVDKYIGFGGRMRSRDFYTFNCEFDGAPICYKHSTGPGSHVQFFPDFHLGVRFGYRK